jgi:hypothetical protein
MQGQRCATDELHRLLAATQHVGWPGGGVTVAGFSKGCLVVSALLREAAAAACAQAAALAGRMPLISASSAHLYSYVFIDPGVAAPDVLFPFTAAEYECIRDMPVRVFASPYQLCDTR